MKRKQRPSWLDKKINILDCLRVDSLLKGLDLNTVCRSANCPNIGECFRKGEATFLILGDICTRKCGFCNIKKGDPEPPDPGEPRRIAEAAKRLGLRHAVITSVTRDDLSDGGASLFVETIEALRQKNKGIIIEVLIPDFCCCKKAIGEIVNAHPKIIGHNLETVPRLYPKIRIGAGYRRSLEVLRSVKDIDSTMLIKSGLMLGLGEKRQEVLDVLMDLRKAGCDLLTLGQYLAPSKNHYPVQQYLSPEVFESYKAEAETLGFLHVKSSPYARSSYMASEYIS